MTQGYDLSRFKLPPAKEFDSPPPATSAVNSPAKSPMTGTDPNSSSRGYDLSVFDLPEKIEIPQRTKDGKEASEKIHIRDFGKHVRAQVEDALNYAAPESAVTALYWQIGCAKGAGLMDEATLERFEKLGAEFAASKDRKAYFRGHITPFLNSLTAARRKK
jgi:hypothetical protein